MSIVECEYCKKKFKRDSYHLNLYKKHFCSEKCKQEYFLSKKIKTVCDYCGKELILNPYEFNRSKRHFCNKECSQKQKSKEALEYKEKRIEKENAYNRAYYHAHPEIKEERKKKYKTSEFRLKASNRVEKYKQNNIKRLIENNLITDCIICGFSKENFEALDFHHIKSETKIYNISNLLRKTSNIMQKKEYVEEIKKCVCLCANCHRLYHANNKKVVQKFNEVINNGITTISERNS